MVLKLTAHWVRFRLVNHADGQDLLGFPFQTTTATDPMANMPLVAQPATTNTARVGPVFWVPEFNGVELVGLQPGSQAELHEVGASDNAAIWVVEEFKSE